MQAPAHSLNPGDVVGRRYVVQGPLGSGSMGEIFLALQRPFDRPAAIKVLRPWVGAEADMERRFLLEAQVLSRLSHPNTVTVYEFGRHKDAYFIAMEYVRGRSLAELVNEQGPLAPEDAVPLAVQVAQSLSEAHSLGIIHRDLKPENILVSQRSSSAPFIKVVDFGIAKFSNDARSSAAMVGTPHFMAPEQARGGRIDGRADLYALGCVLFEMLTGHPPFEGDLSMEVVMQHLDAPRPNLPSHLPVELDAFVRRAMSVDPDDRPADANAFVAELVVAATAEAGRSLNGNRGSHSSSVQLAALGASGATPLPPPLPHDVSTDAPVIGDDRPTLIGSSGGRITEESDRTPRFDDESTDRASDAASPAIDPAPGGAAIAPRTGGFLPAVSNVHWILAAVVLAVVAAAIVLIVANAGDEPRSVTIDSAPSGAVVEIDGRPMGVTPLTLGLTEGTDALEGRIQLDGYEPQPFARSVEPGEEVFFALKRAVVELEIVAPEAVRDGTLTVNGESYGAVGADRVVRLEWPAERLRVELDDPEFQTLVESIPASALQPRFRVEFGEGRLVRR